MEALRQLPEALISAVNIAEVVQVIMRRGRDVDDDLALLAMTGVEIVDADADVARLAGELEHSTRQYDISLGDRFCLALAIRRNLPILTADRPWRNLVLPVSVNLLR